jgi:hypothetical protein
MAVDVIEDTNGLSPFLHENGHDRTNCVIGVCEPIIVQLDKNAYAQGQWYVPLPLEVVHYPPRLIECMASTSHCTNARLHNSGCTHPGVIGCTMVVAIRTLSKLKLSVRPVRMVLTHSSTLQVSSIFVIFKMTPVRGLLNPVFCAVAQADIMRVESLVFANQLETSIIG